MSAVIERERTSTARNRVTLISSDNHINEPPDAFARVPKKFKDRHPRLMRAADGGDGWSYDGIPPKRSLGIEAMAGFAKKDFVLSGLRFEQLRPGNYDGDAHLKDMDIDDVYGSVLFPSAAIALYAQPDMELANACLRSYNDWIIDDFQSADPKRLTGLPCLPTIPDVQEAVDEIERMVKKGAKAFFIPGNPDVPYNHPTHYEALWAAASAHDVALCFHRNHGGKPDKTDWDELVEQKVSIGGIVTRYFSAVRPLSYLIFAGTFDRHPKLKIVGAEVDCGWVPFWVQTMVAHWENQRSWFPVKLDHSPVDFVGVNVFTTNIDDYMGYDLVKTGKYPFLTNMTMFSSDYPHSATIWPRSREVAEKMTEGMNAQDKHTVLYGNAARVFKYQR